MDASVGRKARLEGRLGKDRSPRQSGHSIASANYDGVNIAARLEGICAPGAICLSEDAYRQVKGRLDLVVTDLGPTQLKNIADPIRVYSLQVGVPAQAKPAKPAGQRYRRSNPRRKGVRRLPRSPP